MVPDHGEEHDDAVAQAGQREQHGGRRRGACPFAIP